MYSNKELYKMIGIEMDLQLESDVYQAIEIVSKKTRASELRLLSIYNKQSEIIAKERLTNILFKLGW